MDFKNHIRTIPDFPKPGILFYDIATLLADKTAWREAILEFAKLLRPYQPDYLVGIDARGFLIAGALAIELDCGVAMIRKAGKLPGTVESYAYNLEYGSGILEVQNDIMPPRSKVILLDDLLATGGTLEAAVALLHKIKVDPLAIACLIELPFLQGRQRIDIPCHSLLTYDS